MNDSKISVRYSRALFGIALEKGLLDKVFADMELLSELCRIPEVKELLTSPIIVPSKKIMVFNKLLGKSVQEITHSLVNLAVNNGREAFIPAIARVFMTETKKHKGVTDTTLTTAVKIDTKIKKEISSLVSEVFNTKAEVEEVVDESIIGGFILRVGDNYVDASVKNKLRKIEKGLKGTLVSK